MDNQIAIDRPSIASTTDMVLNIEAMQQMSNLAHLMSEGKVTVPKHLQGSPADCMAIVMQAAQWKMNPYAVAQKTHLVNGVLGYEAQLVNAVISSSKAINGRFHYQYGGGWQVDGDNVGVVSSNTAGVNVNKGTKITPDSWVQVGAILAGETEIQWGEPLFPANVTTKNSPLWMTAPKQQAAYLAVKYWARLYAPAVILGVYSSDELQVSPIKERELNPQANSNGHKSKLDQVLSGDVIDPVEKNNRVFDELVLAILSVSNLDELNEVGFEVAKKFKASLITPEERKSLGADFKKRQREFAPVDTETGEVA
ncbi:recombinase RecT [Shewanella sp. D64]|uniref:RecT family recombinase n=1 Tax=unclassified Shewanella TaxID=196818 RepID=UPI0022BA1322|nr:MULTISPECIES: RecT family recombinase [unclassified Shewanella]MEC4724291.1 recombinase RecT [Shewanella sp. D64]MEC4738803.1 recombinase RecT [Shewanella sp. E94]WBJ97758.1 recombinase RecT [Shewanella sp. MTB7]